VNRDGAPNGFPRSRPMRIERSPTLHGASREKEIFERAIEFSGGTARVACLQEACGGDASLFERLQRLLAAHDLSSTFLPSQPRTDATQCEPAGPVECGTSIGPYRLLELLGEGGFGVVYKAEQIDPIQRSVALKIIKPGMDSRQVIARFEAERQALARMEHPNIARVFEAGTDGKGRPYFAMELVRGIPITSFCEERQLDVTKRIELFIEVCAAVQHAHQKGVIHRDLKPSNILVTEQEAGPLPKVIDFGIAKALDEPLTERIVFTRLQGFLGTPAYMSPEQMGLGGIDVDTRSDIYSLGVVLYELLTATLPFDPKEAPGAGLKEARQTLLARGPERPSTRLSRLHRQRASLSPLATKVRGPIRIARELDLIVLQALASDRDRRYATANGLAADLRRFLNQEPVTAVAPTLAYQLITLYRRNRRAMATALAFLALFLASAALSTGLAIQAHRAERTAIQEAAAARSVSEFLWQEMLKPLTPWSHTNPGVSLRDAFVAASERIDHRFQDQPLAEASVRLSFARTHLGLIELAAAETNLLRALALRREHARARDQQLADILFQLGTLREFQFRWAEAAALFHECAGIRGETLGYQHPDTATAAAKSSLNRARDLSADAAEPLLQRALSDLRRTAGPENHVVRAILNTLGTLCLEDGRLDQAWDLFAEAHRHSIEHEGPASSGALWSLQLMTETRARQGRFAEAEQAALEIIALREQANGLEHFFTYSAHLLHATHVLAPQGRFAEAAPTLLRAAANARTDQPALLAPVAASMAAVLELWQARGDDPERDEFRRAMDAWLAETPPVSDWAASDRGF
jgi:eukaryotic-like serine/threonine-protein kinase